MCMRNLIPSLREEHTSKDVLKQIAEKNIRLQNIDKTRAEKVHIGTLHNLHFLQNRAIIGEIK